MRNDIGQLWEQYILSERIKYNSYREYEPQYFFWRTYDGQEIDLLELNSQQHLQSLECKWQILKYQNTDSLCQSLSRSRFYYY